MTRCNGVLVRETSPQCTSDEAHSAISINLFMEKSGLMNSAESPAIYGENALFDPQKGCRAAVRSAPCVRLLLKAFETIKRV